MNVTRFAVSLLLGLAACGGHSYRLGGGSEGGREQGGANGNSGGSVFGYGPNGYGFGGFGQTGWAGQVNAAGAPAGGNAGFGSSTAAQACVGYKPRGTLKTETLDSCSAVAQAYEFQDANLAVATGRADGSPGQTESHELVALDPSQCGDSTAWHLTASGLASSGAKYVFEDKTLDYSGWDGIALWVRAGQGTTATFLFALWDAISSGQVIINPETGEKACYQPGDDWDLDGQPNVTLPPPGLSCDGWGVRLSVSDQWQFVLLPWSLWTTDETRAAALGIDSSSIQELQVYTDPCADFDLWIASLGAYRTLQP